ncbi:aminotransferase class I/II-fold pyridoxal phosphate-dependent enzyme, partial [Planctomycetota bacterium]
MGRKLTAQTGILELMEDLGRALTTGPHMRMLAAGNPAAVPEMQALVRARMVELMGQEDAFDRMLANYEPPRGNPRFVQAMARLLQRVFGWEIGPQNVVVTCGAQTASFYLLNLLGGRFEGGRRRRILLAQTPEYIGYADQGLEPGLFAACRPLIERLPGQDGRVFKYRVDFAAVEDILRRGDIGAIAVSRPTNPTGNVLTDEETTRLSDLAADRGVPLIIDGAYGAPFPNVTFVPSRPHWAPHVILTLSLSKLGLPGTRTGIVVAPKPIAKAISSLTAIVGLANGTIGQQLVLPWIEDGSIL